MRCADIPTKGAHTPTGEWAELAKAAGRGVGLVLHLNATIVIFAHVVVYIPDS